MVVKLLILGLVLAFTQVVDAQDNTTLSITILDKAGYIRYARDSFERDATFSDILRFALLTYQIHYGLSTTGVLDEFTQRNILRSHSGNPDFKDGVVLVGTPYDDKRKFRLSADRELCYTFLGKFPKQEDIRERVREALVMWGGEVAIDFVEVDDDGTKNGKKIDITFNFLNFAESGETDRSTVGYTDHVSDDAQQIEKEGIRESHITFIADHPWSYNGTVTQRTYDFRSNALHEVGYALGLHHSLESDAVMYEYLDPGVIKMLTDDDKRGIRELYPGAPDTIMKRKKRDKKY